MRRYRMSDSLAIGLAVGFLIGVVAVKLLGLG